MPTRMSLWRIESEIPKLLAQHKLDSESRLEEWIQNDISLVSDDLLVIGKQVPTQYGGYIDLLSLDSNGNLVILELKKDQTPRDVVAQILDYASWVKKLGSEEIENIASNFLEPNSLEQAFRDKFLSDLPEILNERHRMYIVASNLDSASERIVEYLSESYEIDINVATFAFFKTEDGEFIARSFLLDEEQVQIRAESRSKRKPPRTWEELESLAKENGVREIYNYALSELRPLFDAANRARANAALVGIMGEKKSRNTIVSIYPEASSTENGLALMIWDDRLSEYFSIDKNELNSFLGEPVLNANTWAPHLTYYFDRNKLSTFINMIKDVKM